MTLDGRFEYKKALILTPERIKELEIILLKYCERIAYEATTVAETEITFASVDELLSYDNFQNRRIKSLTMIGRNKIDRVFTCIFEASGLQSLFGYDGTFICRYTVSDVDTETTLKEDILDFLNKATAQFWIFGKIRLLGLLCILCWFSAVYLVGYNNSNTGEKTVLGAFLACILGLSIVGMSITIDQCFLKNLFPPLSFVWGEEKFRFSKYEQLRKNIFWCVIIAIVVGIVVFYITNQLPK